MSKKKLKGKAFLYPLPTILVGANVKGKANFVTIAFCGMLQYKPPMLMISSAKAHYTNEGIKSNNTFSVNIPSIDMVQITDYIGTTSGRVVDKSTLFDVFYGELETAPMITKAPVNHECKVERIIDFGMNEMIIGEIVRTYVNDDCMEKGKPDIRKINPIIFSGSNHYLKVGDVIGEAYKIGREYKKE